PARRDLLPPAESAAGLRLPARLHRRPQPRRIDGGGEPRHRDGAAWLPPLRGAARLRPLLPERHGGSKPPLAIQERPGARMDAAPGHGRANGLTYQKGNVLGMVAEQAARPFVPVTAEQPSSCESALASAPRPTRRGRRGRPLYRSA